MNTPEQYMNAAIAEQRKCTSYPKIGAVLIKDERILATGFRNEVQGKHAERVAIEKVDASLLKGSQIFTTLEPCVEIHNGQSEKSCADLIIENGISEVTIGVLDPNGKIYCQGYSKLAESKLIVNFFTPQLREEVEGLTFKYGDCSIGYGPTGKRRVAVFGSGKNFEIQRSREIDERIQFKWQALQYNHGCVDLVSRTGNDSIRDAIGINSFESISDPLIFRETSHFSRMRVGNIAVLSPPDSSFIILLKLLELTEFDICFQWQIRDKTTANSTLPKAGRQ